MLQHLFLANAVSTFSSAQGNASVSTRKAAGVRARAWRKMGVVCLFAAGLFGTVNAHAQTATPSTPASFGSVNVGTAATPVAVTFNITAGGALGTPLVLTQGAQNKDFTLATGGTCTGTVAVGTCTVNVAFTPAYPGQRFGAVVLLDSGGNTLATGLVSGTGVGPQVVYPASAVANVIASGFNNPKGMAFDGLGNLYVADLNNSVIKEVVAVNGVVSSSSAVNTITSNQGGA